jgi:hypothetical protein
VTNHSREDSGKLIAEVDYVLRFSKIYFDAFKIIHDRMIQWELLCIILNSSEEELKVIKFRADKRVLELLPLDEPVQYNTGYLFKRLMKGFKNERGSFLDIRAPEGKSVGGKERAYFLNDNFHEAAAQYITMFTRAMIPSDLTLKTPEKEVTLQVFKSIMDFIRFDHRDTWIESLKQIAAKTNQAAPKAWLDRVSHNSSYWVVLLSAWKKCLGDRNTLINSAGYTREVYNVIGEPEPNDVTETISDLQRDGVLRREKQDNEWIFPLSSEFESIFEDYTVELARLRTELLSRIGSAIGLPVAGP